MWENYLERTNRLSIAPFSYTKISFILTDLQWVESLSEKYPHIVHEEYSEEINAEECQDSTKDCDLDILEGQFLC
jgi:hypothetical protein